MCWPAAEAVEETIAAGLHEREAIAEFVTGFNIDAPTFAAVWERMKQPMDGEGGLGCVRADDYQTFAPQGQYITELEGCDGNLSHVRTGQANVTLNHWVQESLVKEPAPTNACRETGGF